TVQLQQIWRDEIGLTDRCTSCHVGMGAATPLDNGGSLYGRHPEVGHNLTQMGCTVCHRGEGRATSRLAAHGGVEHWEEPMLPTQYLQASCGTCHGEAALIPPLAQLERGSYLFEINGCRACHVVDGTGGDIGPDLSGVALKGFDREWQIQHLRAPTSMVEGSKMMSFGHLSDAEIDDIVAYLDTLIGAPKLVRGKAIAVELGCRGCHSIGGLGGDMANLDDLARKPQPDYDFTNVEGPPTLDNWHRQHLRTPQTVAPGSVMPPFELPEEQEEALITYILSLRRPELPLSEIPEATRLARMQQRRDFPHDGPALFRTFCAACHGLDGRGQVMESLGTTVPGVMSRDVHTVLSEDALRYTLEHGRPGRHMPAWNGGDSGLTEEEIDSLVDYLRQAVPEPPTFEAVAAATVDMARGERTYNGDCGICHGRDGAGTDTAPSLTSPEFQFLADDRYLFTTITEGRVGTAMPASPNYDARTVASVTAWIRDLGGANTAPVRARGRAMDAQATEILRTDLASYRASGSAAYGEVIFEAMCVNCHGVAGRGNLGPAIANPSFLRAASDGFLAGSILFGRGQRAMLPFGPHGLVQLEGREVGDVIAYLRQLSVQKPETPGFATAQGTAARGHELYDAFCVGCHGPEGAGETAPALRNPAFLDAVTDGFLQATIIRGRRGTAMRPYARGGQLELRDINDIVAYIRSWQAD
ncbi:MAG: c-type cytochrome, partial [Vicinamibacterales bacterium]|nr:c-type cytochrome [Vicinamibacterales bacterium]